MTKTPTERRLIELIETSDVAFLTTTKKSGELDSRPMVNLKNRLSDGLYFFASDDSEIALSLMRNHNVSVTYMGADGKSYASISGRAALLHDRATAEKIWTPELEQWFPKGLDDPHLALVKVKPLTAEYWETPWRAPSALHDLASRFFGKEVNYPEHDRISFA